MDELQEASKTSWSPDSKGCDEQYQLQLAASY